MPRPSLGFDLLRIYLGVALFVRGALFVSNPARAQALIEQSGDWFMPMLLAHFIGAAHLVGGLLLAIGLLVFEFVFSPRGMIALARDRRAVRTASIRRAAAEAETARLAELRAKLESGAAVESTARETYGMARPGEEIYVLPAPESQNGRP
jgi:cell division protein FtsB